MQLSLDSWLGTMETSVIYTTWQNLFQEIIVQEIKATNNLTLGVKAKDNRSSLLIWFVCQTRIKYRFSGKIPKRLKLPKARIRMSLFPVSKSMIKINQQLRWFNRAQTMIISSTEIKTWLFKPLRSNFWKFEFYILFLHQSIFTLFEWL